MCKKDTKTLTEGGGWLLVGCPSYVSILVGKEALTSWAFTGRGAGDPGKNTDMGEAPEPGTRVAPRKSWRMAEEDGLSFGKFWAGLQGHSRVVRLSAVRGEVQCRLGCWRVMKLLGVACVCVSLFKSFED